jgi:hypothetical protein
MSLNVRRFVPSVIAEVTEVMSAPGFTNPFISNSSLRLCFILLAESRVLLSPTIMIFSSSFYVVLSDRIFSE